MTDLTTLISLKTSELQLGDIVVSHGLKLLIDRDILISESHPKDGPGGACRYTKALVLNRDDVPGTIVPLGWTARWDRNRSYDDAVPHDGEHRWTVQGNDLARWLVERAG